MGKGVWVQPLGWGSGIASRSGALRGRGCGVQCFPGATGEGWGTLHAASACRHSPHNFPLATGLLGAGIVCRHTCCRAAEKCSALLSWRGPQTVL